MKREERGFTFTILKVTAWKSAATYNRARDLFPEDNCASFVAVNVYTTKEDSAIFSVNKGWKCSWSQIYNTTEVNICQIITDSLNVFFQRLN